MGGSGVEGLSQLRQRHGRALCQRALKNSVKLPFYTVFAYLILAALIKRKLLETA
jgi:hypothetical protein